jgi:putative transposase
VASVHINGGLGWGEPLHPIYTPQQNGIVERFFRSVKEECVWQHQFRTFADARRRTWIEWYNERRPHQALGYRSPKQFRAQQLNLVA